MSSIASSIFVSQPFLLLLTSLLTPIRVNISHIHTNFNCAHPSTDQFLVTPFLHHQICTIVGTSDFTSKRDELLRQRNSNTKSSKSVVREGGNLKSVIIESKESVVGAGDVMKGGGHTAERNGIRGNEGAHLKWQQQQQQQQQQEKDEDELYLSVMKPLQYDETSSFSSYFFRCCAVLYISYAATILLFYFIILHYTSRLNSLSVVTLILIYRRMYDAFALHVMSRYVELRLFILDVLRCHLTSCYVV